MTIQGHNYMGPITSQGHMTTNMLAQLEVMTDVLEWAIALKGRDYIHRAIATQGAITI